MTAAPKRPVSLVIVWLASKANWLSLNRFSQSFLAKGVTILSLTAFALSNFPEVEAVLGGSGWRIKALFFGSLLFVFGHLLAAANAPAEFNGRSEATQIVAEMLVLDTKSFFDGRLQLLQALVKRFELNPPPDMPVGHLRFAQLVLREVASLPTSATAFKDHSQNVYHADIQLRQFAKPYARFWALSGLGVGAAIMIVPTGLNVLITLMQFAGLTRTFARPLLGP